MTFPFGIHPIIQDDLLSICSAELPWSKLANKSILITGGNGFLPSYLSQALLTANKVHGLNIKVICVTRRSPHHEDRLHPWRHDSNLGSFTQDISLPLQNNFPKADIIIHAASQASPKYYSLDPVGTLSANSIGTANLLNHARYCSSSKFLFFSSGEIYGQPLNSNKQISEKDYGYVDPTNLRSCYAESKRMGENMCISWAEQFKVDASIVRPFHTYGPGMSLDDGRVFADFVRDVVNQEDITLNSAGTAVRAFCYIADATIGFLTVLLKGGIAQAYNIGNPDAAISMADLANTLTKLFPERNLKVQTRLSTSSIVNNSISKAIPCIDKIKELSWIPTTTINAGFKRTVNSFL